jgi:hypothetical protein
MDKHTAKGILGDRWGECDAKEKREAATYLANIRNESLTLYLETLSDETARILGKAKCYEISFPDLRHLSDQAITDLCKFSGDLGLDCLQALPDAAFKNLRNPWGGEVSLNGLRELSPVAARYLTKRGAFRLQLGLFLSRIGFFGKGCRLHRPTLGLDSLTTISDDVASELSKYQGCLGLNGLKTLSDDAVDFLSNYRGGYLQLDGLESLPDQHVRKLCSVGGALSLNGLSELTEESAKAFGQFKGDYLSLDGITALTHKAAESLAIFGGALNLDGLTHLSDAAAASLSRNRRRLNLNGLKELSETAAEALVSIAGLEVTGLEKLTESVASHLSKWPGNVFWFLNLKVLSDAAAKNLANFRGEALSFNSLEDVSENAIKHLSRFNGKELDFGRLNTISDLAADYLGQFQGRSLGMNGLTTISDQQVDGLSKFRGLLLLEGITSLSDNSVRIFEERKTNLKLSPFCNVPQNESTDLWKTKTLF